MTAWWTGLAPGTVLTDCHWTGAKKDKERGNLVIGVDGIEYRGSVAIPFSIQWGNVTNIEVIEGSDRKISAARMAAMGPLALAAKKKVDTVNVVVTHAGGSETFVASQSADEVYQALAPLLARFPNQLSSPQMLPDQQSTPPQVMGRSVESSGSSWWTGIPENEIRDVGVITGNVLSKTSTLRLTRDGIEWGEKKTGLVKIPWATVKEIKLGESTGQRGRTVGTYVPRSVTGVVNTAARAAHNAKASKVVTRTVVAITTSKETHKFQVEKPSDDVLAVIGPAIRSLNQYQATLDVLTAPPPPVESPAPAVQPPPSQATPTSVADELKKLAELRDAGILSEEEFVAAKARLL